MATIAAAAGGKKGRKFELTDLEEMKFGLTDIQISELKEAFSLYDKDDEGVITPKNLGLVMSSLEPDIKPTEKELKELIAEVDTHGDGDLDFTDFLKMMAGRKDLDKLAEVKHAFQVFDTSGNGFITSRELKGVMSKLGEELTDEEISVMMSKVDPSGTGKIGFEQFCGLMMGGESE
eukprot:TRINITY_DN17817_c0_g1_i2.p1 TRINITY_DN17817_c0_g1~~TRINITY_DN17817_c0_g1_i2.p1  ORF type:complete len:177 (+),score=35.96 TRINITY_DN17817_c0_g1_i2:117-647(+)